MTFWTSIFSTRKMLDAPDTEEWLYKKYSYFLESWDAARETVDPSIERNETDYTPEGIMKRWLVISLQGRRPRYHSTRVLDQRDNPWDRITWTLELETKWLSYLPPFDQLKALAIRLNKNAAEYIETVKEFYSIIERAKAADQRDKAIAEAKRLGV